MSECVGGGRVGVSMLQQVQNNIVWLVMKNRK